MAKQEHDDVDVALRDPIHLSGKARKHANELWRRGIRNVDTVVFTKVLVYNGIQITVEAFKIANGCFGARVSDRKHFIKSRIPWLKFSFRRDFGSLEEAWDWACRKFEQVAGDNILDVKEA